MLTLSIELGQANIRVNAILPGAVEGPRIQHVIERMANVSGKSVAEVTKEALANQSIKRFVDPKDIAALALFLASDSARSISGQISPLMATRSLPCNKAMLMSFIYKASRRCTTVYFTHLEFLSAAAWRWDFWFGGRTH